MNRRLDALTRIERVQKLMHDVGRSRLHSLDRQLAELNDDLKAVFEALDGDKIAYGAQAGLVARRIRALQVRLYLLGREQDSARRSVLTQGTRAKLAELAIESAALDSRRLNERKELAEIIERALARGASST
jgi:alkylation response protein AidB-like acyl-CoA dehydrogenase